MKNSILILLCLISLGLTSCGNKNSSLENGNVTQVEDNDKEINQAIDKAKNTFDAFKKVFIENQTTDKYTDFAIKEGFPTSDGGKEHMWVSELTFDGTNLVGILVNEPTNITNLQYGDTITIKKDMISDWVYTDKASNLTYGGYTMRVFVDRMKKQEKAAFEQENGIMFAPLSE